MSKSSGRELALTAADIARWQALVPPTATCWVWLGAVGSDGYGRFGIRTVDHRGRTVTPHQVAAVLAGGELESGVTILHDCDLRLCCRTDPGHVRVATQTENMRQAAWRGALAVSSKEGPDVAEDRARQVHCVCGADAGARFAESGDLMGGAAHGDHPEQDEPDRAVHDDPPRLIVTAEPAGLSPTAKAIVASVAAASTRAKVALTPSFTCAPASGRVPTDAVRRASTCRVRASIPGAVARWLCYAHNTVAIAVMHVRQVLPR